MKKTLAIILGLLTLVIIILGFGVYKFNFTNDDIHFDNTIGTSPQNATYTIEGQKVTLKNGVSEVSIAPGSASKIVTRYFGNAVSHDFDGDGREDSAFILTQETGGSGTFYYVVAALNTVDGYVGSEGVLLGDRIAPQTTEMGKGNIIVVNYADRNPGESFDIRPSVGKSIWLLLDPKTMQFGEVAQNFEGEADPSKMTLGMKTWSWINTVYGNGKEVKPRTEKKFTLTFKNDKTFSATTDCNGVGGEYTVSGNKISFDKMMSTLMYCEGSQDGYFIGMLGEVETYSFTSKGELLLGLKQGGGTVALR
ncbi:MAG: META domain-containing protein [Candidatus Pacebacteria bacterium]|nr:META domain-containing protein [Candidatus Paceibacterota bacterium]